MVKLLKYIIVIWIESEYTIENLLDPADEAIILRVRKG